MNRFPINLEREFEMLDSENKNDIVDTTDCLEAMNACRGMKNFLFTIMLICLVILQVCFWLDRAGFVNRTEPFCPACATCTEDDCSTVAVKNAEMENQLEPVTVIVGPQLPAPEDDGSANLEEIQLAADAEKVTEEILPVEQQAELIEQPSVGTDTASTEKTDETKQDEKNDVAKLLTPKAKHLAALIRVCNFILIIFAALFSLMLLFGIKISLVGRLGGINHICRAFIISLFAFVLLLPWQSCFPSVVVGVIYTPKELFCIWAADADVSVVKTVFCYLRFTGLWIIELMLLLFTQLRSAKWSRATLRRLGILQ